MTQTGSGHVAHTGKGQGHNWVRSFESKGIKSGGTTGSGHVSQRALNQGAQLGQVMMLKLC